MKKVAGWKAILMHLVAVAVLGPAAPALAQLEIGGQPFEGDSAPAAEGDELTQRIQRDLVALGYEPGSISGEMTVDTAVAISKFQAENGLDVTGEASPQLAGILAARVSGNSPAEASASVSLDAAASAETSADCVPAAAEAPSDAGRSAGRLARAGGRLFSRFGGDDAQRHVAEATRTASDVAEIADVVGDLTECEP